MNASVSGRVLSKRALRLKLYTCQRRAIESVATCPDPTCSCQPTPPGLDIDHASAMTFSPYCSHITVCTGQDDWASKIEMDTTSTPVTRHLKTLLGPPGKRATRGRDGWLVPGKYHNPYNPTMITNASFTSPQDSADTPSESIDASKNAKLDLPATPTSLLFFPSFREVVVHTPPDITAYLDDMDSVIHEILWQDRALFGEITDQEQAYMETIRSSLNNDTKSRNVVRPIDQAVIMICGHGNRDSRCGVLGLLLQHEFEQKLQSTDIEIARWPKQNERSETKTISRQAMVGLTSHIGGHKWAGNVIIYIPPAWTDHPLSASALWYGRVEPKHIEGIVYETLKKGTVIKNLWRGGMQLQAPKDGVSTSNGRRVWTQIPM